MADTATPAPPDDTTKRLSGATATKAPPPDYSRLSGMFGDTAKRRIKMDETERRRGARQPAPPTLTPPAVAAAANRSVAGVRSARDVVAALGGLLARGPLTSAITSAGAVMDATHKHDSANAQRAFEEWKIQSANGLKMAKYTLDQLNSALKEEETDSRAGQARTTTLLNSLKLTELQKLHDSDPAAYERAIAASGEGGPVNRGWRQDFRRPADYRCSDEFG